MIILIVDDVVVVIVDAVEGLVDGGKFKLLIVLCKHTVEFDFALSIEVNLQFLSFSLLPVHVDVQKCLFCLLFDSFILCLGLVMMGFVMF
jgi:hypothetical protein